LGRIGTAEDAQFDLCRKRKERVATGGPKSQGMQKKRRCKKDSKVEKGRGHGEDYKKRGGGGKRGYAPLKAVSLLWKHGPKGLRFRTVSRGLKKCLTLLKGRLIKGIGKRKAGRIACIQILHYLKKRED